MCLVLRAIVQTGADLQAPDLPVSNDVEDLRTVIGVVALRFADLERLERLQGFGGLVRLDGRVQDDAHHYCLKREGCDQTGQRILWFIPGSAFIHHREKHREEHANPRR